jgi:SAM-dependent methyltransferase
VPGPDYERGGAATSYRARRTLPDQTLEAWHHALTVAVDGSVSTILDVGSGTGQFVAPLERWFRANVVAIEPSAAMRAQSSAPWLVAGSAEAMPIAAASIDLAWLSTVVHQLRDLDAVARELRRVLRSGGRVAVRGYFADQGPIGWFGHFPGIERSIARFPRADAVIDAFASAGIELQIATTVDEVWLLSAAGYTDVVRDLRHADSMLVPLTDQEIDAGLASIAASYPDPRAVHEVHSPLRLLVLAVEA